MIRSSTNHIKRDGGLLCRIGKSKDKDQWFYKNAYTVKFSHVHKMTNTEALCQDCVEVYYQILGRMKDPIIVDL